ncbi:MAG: hypothetical protein AABW59_01620 [archaeon]
MGSVKNVFGSHGQITIEFIVTIIVVLFIFGFGLFIFEQRSLLNLEKSQEWAAQETAHRISRGINNVYLADGNVTMGDYIYWSGGVRKVDFGTRAVRVWLDEGRYVDSPVVAPHVIWDVIDVNGLLVFSKTNGVIYVRGG